MDTITDEEMGEAIENITYDIILLDILNDAQQEEKWQKEIVNLLHHYFYENGINCDLNYVYFSFLEWINTESNLAILLSSVYPLEDRIKFRETFAVCDLPCILNGINPYISLEAKKWMYAKTTFMNDISLINDAIFSKKLKPVPIDGQLVVIYDNFLLDTRLLHITNITEWIDTEKEKDTNFPLKLPEFIAAYKQNRPEYSDNKNDNSDYMDFIYYLRSKFITKIKEGTTAEKLLDLIKQEKTETESSNKGTFYVFKYGEDKKIKVTNNLLTSFVTIIRGSELSSRS